MELRFWGVRGSIPTPGPHALAVGGNTMCLSIEREGHLFIFDAGTGIARLRRYLEEERADIAGCIFLSHYHWDHIQGLPFFAPAFRKQNRFHLYGQATSRLTLHDILADQMQAPYFPIGMETLEGLVTFNSLQAGENVSVSDDIVVRTTALNHPNGALGYRLETPESTICVITDHEHPKDGLDASVVKFAQGAKVLIHEAPYHPEEKLAAKAGWGHSTWEEAALTAKAAGVDRLFLIHHDPERSDTEVFDILSMARNIFPATDVATETTVVDLSELGG